MENEMQWTDSSDDSRWLCEGVSNSLDRDGHFSVQCKCIKNGIPNKKSRTGRRVRTAFSVRHLRGKQKQKLSRSK